jgi:hypothetical protein
MRSDQWDADVNAKESDMGITGNLLRWSDSNTDQNRVNRRLDKTKEFETSYCFFQR